MLSHTELECIEQDFEWARDHDQLPDWMHLSVPRVLASHRTLTAQLAAANAALQAARPVVAGRSCWHKDDPDVDCCDCPEILELIDAALGAQATASERGV